MCEALNYTEKRVILNYTEHWFLGYIGTYRCTYPDVYICAYTHILYIYICISCMCIHIYICIYIDIYAFMYILWNIQEIEALKEQKEQEKIQRDMVEMELTPLSWHKTVFPFMH